MIKPVYGPVDADMTAESEGYAERRIKHLEMIQGALARMSGNSGTIKRYAVVVTVAAISLARFIESTTILVVAGAIVVVFALLDARYLRLERGYRRLYDAVRLEPDELRPDFRLAPEPDGVSLWAVLGSWSVAGLYGALIFFIAIVICLAGRTL